MEYAKSLDQLRTPSPTPQCYEISNGLSIDDAEIKRVSIFLGSARPSTRSALRLALRLAVKPPPSLASDRQ